MRRNLNLQELVNFYDYRIDSINKVDSSHKHATAINSVLGEDLAVALLTHYFKYQENLEVEAPDEPCTGGKQAGTRLDKWVKTANKTTNDVTLYQVEIKNWSAHSIGGDAISKTTDLSKYRKKRWLHQFKTQDPPYSLKQEQTQKVLTRMKPKGNLGAFEKDVKPLICFWEGLHPNGESTSFFRVPVAKSTEDGFDQLFVFSMSNYVHQLLGQNITTLDVGIEDMQNAEARIKWLNRLYPES